MTPSPLPPAPAPTSAAAPARAPGTPAAGRPPETAAFGQWLERARGAPKAPPSGPPNPRPAGTTPPAGPPPGREPSTPPSAQPGGDAAARWEADGRNADETAAPTDAPTDTPSASGDGRHAAAGTGSAAPDAPNASDAPDAPTVQLAPNAADAGEDTPSAAGPDSTRAAARGRALPGLSGSAAGGSATTATDPHADAGQAAPSPGIAAASGGDALRTDGPVTGTPAAGAAAATGATGAADGAGAATALGSAAHAAATGALGAPGVPGAPSAPGTPGMPAAPDSAARAATPPADSLPAPLHSPAFAPALAARVVVMLREGTREARLQLNPAELGPIGVRISVDGRQARVDLMADQAPTRSVLEQALPSLAGALRDSGLTLSGGGVFDAPRDGRRGNQEAPAGTRGSASTAADDGLADTAGPGAAPARVAPRGMLDLYA